MKTKFIYILSILLFYTASLEASKVVVSKDIGFDSEDNTAFLQIALQETSADTIVIDNVGMDWITGPLRVERNDITIVFEAGVVVRALPDAFDIFESLFRITEKSNIRMLGYGASLIMNKQEYIDLADSEFRHGILLQSATNIRIEGLTILDTGGDGILITRSFLPNSMKNYCENVFIKNCRFSNNYRQGMSITSAKNLTILNCEFSDTKGTLPEDGIDFEPDDQAERLENILVKDCRIFNNFGNALQFALLNLDDKSIDVSIDIENTYMANNHDPSNTFAFAEIAATDNGANGVDGYVNFKNCFIESSEWTAVYVSKTVESYDMNFTDCVFKDVSNNPIALNNPIFLEVTNYYDPVPRFGGLHFTNCAIIYDEDIPFFNLIENAPTSEGLGNVTGNFFIFNPNDAGFNTGQNPENVDITYEYFESISKAEISLTANQLEYLEEDVFIQYQFSSSETQDYPIALTFEYDGDARYALDYDIGRGFAIIPSNTTSIIDTLEILQDTILEGAESLFIGGLDDDCVQFTSNNSLLLFISDMILSSTQDHDVEHSFGLFPNPASSHFLLTGDLKGHSIEIINVLGHSQKVFNEIEASQLIDVSDLNSGLYFVKITNLNDDVVEIHQLVKQ